MSGHSKTPEAAMAAYQLISEQPTTLTDFLLARIAEDEARVRVEGIHPGGPYPGLGSVLTDWEERRWLAECEAKRRIVELHRTVGYEDAEMNEVGTGCYTCGFADEECETLCALALPYADHPDCREEWKP